MRQFNLIGVYSVSDTFCPPAPASRRYNWIPPGMPYTFGIEKVKNRLAAALLFECKWTERFVVLLGSTTEFEVGFNAAPIQDLESVEDLFRAYEPQSIYPESTSPRTMSSSTMVGNRCIQIKVYAEIVSKTKYYMVDIHIRGN